MATSLSEMICDYLEAVKLLEGDEIFHCGRVCSVLVLIPVEFRFFWVESEFRSSEFRSSTNLSYC